jgi:hypothetical protein
VRAHPLLRRLLQVELDRPRVDAHPDRDPQPITVGPVAPQPAEVELVGVAQLQQVAQPEVAGGELLARRGAEVGAGKAQRRQLPRQHLRVAEVERVGGADARRALHRGCGERAVVGHVEHDRRVVEQPRRRVGQVDDGHAVDATLGHQVIGAHRGAAVDDHQHVRRRDRRSPDAEPRPVDEGVVEHRFERRDTGRHETHRPHPVVLLRVQRVRHPLGPLPERALRLRDTEAERRVVRGVERGVLGDDRPHQAPGRLVAAAHVDPGEVAKGDRDRKVRHDRVRRDETAQRDRAQGLELVDRAGLRRDQRRRDLLRAQADADHAEIRVVAATLPQSCAGRGGPQALRVGVPVEQGLPLLPDGLADLRAQVAQHAHVLPPRLDHLGLARPGRLGHQLHPDHAQDGRAVHAAGDVGERAARAEAHHQAHRGGTRHHRQDHQQLRPAPAVGRRVLRRRVQNHLAAGHRRRGPAGWSFHDDRRHAGPPPIDCPPLAPSREF